jgi:hypothetical protein
LSSGVSHSRMAMRRVGIFFVVCLESVCEMTEESGD